MCHPCALLEDSPVDHGSFLATKRYISIDRGHMSINGEVGKPWATIISVLHKHRLVGIVAAVPYNETKELFESRQYGAKTLLSFGIGENAGYCPFLFGGGE